MPVVLKPRLGLPPVHAKCRCVVVAEHYIGVVGRIMSKPVVAPEAYNSEGSFTDWVDHFENVAALNKWKEEKVLWLRVRLTGKAQTAFKQLPVVVHDGAYDTLVKGLHQRFEPDSRRELYAAEFHCPRKQKGESWSDFGDDLSRLVSKAHPDLGSDGRQQLALHQYLANLVNPQVSFGVKQRWPKMIDEAVTATLEMESYLVPAVGLGKVAQVSQVDPDPRESVVAAVKTQQEAMMEMMSQLVQRMDRLETPGETSEDQGYGRRVGRSRGSTTPRNLGTVVCYNCGQAGHFRRGCAASKKQGNGKPPA